MIKTIILLSASLILFSCTRVKGKVIWQATGKPMEGIEIQLSDRKTNDNTLINNALKTLKTDSEGCFSTNVWFYSSSNIIVQAIEPDSLIFEPSIWVLEDKKGEMKILGYPSGQMELKLRCSDGMAKDITWEIIGHNNTKTGLKAFQSDSNINFKIKAETLLGLKFKIDGQTETDSLTCAKGEKIIYTLAY